jgi:dolichyl-phosphate-mannose--protein O-mannosyl transferase
MKPRAYLGALMALTFSLFLAHMYIIGMPDRASCFSEKEMAYRCIMDEYYYIPWANQMAKGGQCLVGAGYCHLEHPPLGVAFIALGIWLFGNDALGWRFFVALLGTMGVPLLYFLALKISGQVKLALSSALLLSLDTLYFVHSSAALIDIPAVFFLVTAFLLLAHERRLLCGLALGLAGLSKETAAFGAGALLTYVWLSTANTRKKAQSLILIAATALVTFIVGLEVFDLLYAGLAFRSFIDHIAYMISYGASLKGPGWFDPMLGRPITPLDWLVAYSPVNYYLSRSTISTGGTYLSVVDIGYYGIANVAITWATFIWLPLALWDVLHARSWASSCASYPIRKEALLASCYFLWGYLPYLALYALGRVTYPFYILTALPGMCLGSSYLIERLRFPRWARLSYYAIGFAWFIIFFPHKGFLPYGLRAHLRF